jgi:hypothetical protein
MNIPNMALVGELILDLGSDLVNLFIRGFNINVATRPVVPPTTCTGPAPAMSITFSL